MSLNQKIYMVFQNIEMNPPTIFEESMDCGVGMDYIAGEQVGDEVKL